MSDLSKSLSGSVLAIIMYVRKIYDNLWEQSTILEAVLGNYLQYGKGPRHPTRGKHQQEEQHLVQVHSLSHLQKI